MNNYGSHFLYTCSNATSPRLLAWGIWNFIDKELHLCNVFTIMTVMWGVDQHLGWGSGGQMKDCIWLKLNVLSRRPHLLHVGRFQIKYGWNCVSLWHCYGPCSKIYISHSKKATNVFHHYQKINFCTWLWCLCSTQTAGLHT